MTAVVLGTYFKVPDQKIKSSIEHYVPSDNRSQIIKVGTNTFILDAYNANPTSMQNALLFFEKMDATKKVAILGAMKELGDCSKAEHQSIVDQAMAGGYEQVVLIGNEYLGKGEMVFENVNLLKEWFVKQNFRDTHFLLKGSRSIGLEKLMDATKITD